MTRDDFIRWFREELCLRTDGAEFAALAADCIERAVRAERRGWCGDERGGFEQSAYTLPTPWSAAAGMSTEGKDDET